MNKIFISSLLLSVVIAVNASGSIYSGQQNREIKSLSEQDINALKSGSGWNLAKPAELNGIPGPAHLLELKEELKLSVSQLEKIQAIWSEMNKSAKRYGQYYLETEEKIERFFRDQHNRKQDIVLLQQLLTESSQYLTKLRETHLSAHLKV